MEEKEFYLINDVRNAVFENQIWLRNLSVIDEVATTFYGHANFVARLCMITSAVDETRKIKNLIGYNMVRELACYLSRRWRVISKGGKGSIGRNKGCN